MALFKPLNNGIFKLANRIALAPMTRGRATENNVPTKPMITYYTQRKDALLISEGTGISKSGLGWFKAPGIWNSTQINAWRSVTDSVHKAGGIIGCQLWHLGRQGHTHTTGDLEIVSASPTALKGEVPTKPTDATIKDGSYIQELKPYEIPYPLLNDKGKSGHDNYKVTSDYVATITGVVGDFGKAAQNAMEAGFDFVEIHGANGYLIDQFIQSSSNTRNDEYGGSIENRLRFMKEIVLEIYKYIEPKRVGIRLSPNGVFGQIGSKDNNETFTEAIKWLTINNIGYIHIMDGLGFGFHNLSTPFELKDARNIIDKYTDTKDTTKDNKDTKAKDYKTLLIGNVGYTKETAEDSINDGIADIIAFGRPFLSNPDLVKRFKDNIELNDIAERSDWWDVKPAINGTGYIDYPIAGK